MYVGEWKDGLPNGKGIFNWPDGNKFECSKRNDCTCFYYTYVYLEDRRFQVSSERKIKRLKEMCFPKRFKYCKNYSGKRVRC